MHGKDDEIRSLEEFKVSIIIPVYNTEKYVGRAIQSAISQTYKNIEIIIVDDGSTDKSAEICKKYVNLDSRVKYFYIENNGVSAARNIGIKKSTGDFIQFLDSDDEMALQKTEILMKLAKEKEADIVFGGYEMYKDGKVSLCIPQKLGYGNLFFQFYMSEDWLCVLGVVWTSIIRTSVIKENKLIFDEKLRIGEDGLFTLDCLKYTQRIEYIAKPLYKTFKFEKEERLSATGYFCYDIYKFLVEHFERINNYGRIDWEKEDGRMLSGRFFDKLVPTLIVCYGFLRKYNTSEINEIKKYLCYPSVVKAAKYYKRSSKKDSILIPLGIRVKSLLLVRVGLNRRIKTAMYKYPELNECIGIYKN